MYGLQSISYGQEITPVDSLLTSKPAGSAPTVTPGETNDSLKVRFTDVLYKYSENAYQIQLRRKTPQGDWSTKCISIKMGGGGGLSDLPLIGVFFSGGAVRERFNIDTGFANLEPGVTYEVRYRDTNLSECHANPPSPDPWSPISEGTTHLITPPRVEFVDANLARAVRRALRLNTLGEHIDLLKIPEAALVELIHLEYNNDRDTSMQWRIDNLTGLEHAPQLSILSLQRNNFSDLTPLAQLSQLTELDLSHNSINDLTPLAQLTQLTELILGGNNISDLTPLTQLTQLTELSLSNNNIDDITPLKELTQLTELILGSNNISDLTPLTQLTQLTELSLSNNNIDDITPLKELTQLTELDLAVNNIIDVTPLVELRSLELLLLLFNPIKDSFPLNALIEANPDVYIDIEVLKEERPRITVSTPQPLTGTTLDGAIVKLTLSSGSFDEWRGDFEDAFTIFGIPGIDIDDWYSIEVVNAREAEVNLTFEGDLITTDSVLTLTVAPEAIAGYNGDAYTLEIPVTAVSEAELVELSKALVASTDYPLTAVTLNGAIVKLTLTSGIYKRTYYIENALKVSGIDGVTIHSDRTGDPIISRVSDTEITIELRFSSNITEDATLIFTIASSAIDRYNGPPRTAEIPVSATTEVEPTGELVASSAFPLTKATLNGSIVKLTLQNKSYQGSSYDYREPVVGISGIPGVETARLGSGSYLWILSEREIWVNLLFNGNLDNDVTLTFTVPPSLIKDYNGLPLTATLPITVKTGKQVLVPESSHPSMYWINTQTGKIESLSGFDAVTNQVASLTVDTTDGKIYWSEHGSSDGTIKRANLDGTNVEVLATRPTTPQSITVDAPGKKLYWINSLEGKIQQADLSGGNIKTIIQLDDTITHVAVDAKGGKLYWADSEFRIRRINLDGTDIETILTGWNSHLPRGIGGMAIADDKIYWTERQIWYRSGGKIHRANLNGTNLETLVTSLGEPLGIAVDATNGKIYWGNSFGGIQRIDINGGEIENVVYGIVAPGGLALGPVSTQPTIPTTPETPATTDVAVSISPASVASPAIGQQMEFNLNITDGEAVAGYQATVQFDDTALRYVSSANGDFLPANAFFVDPVVEGNLVKLNAASLAGETNGDGTLATLTFEVIAVKASVLTLSDVLLTNSAGEAIVPQTENTQITAHNKLKEDINGDDIVNIQDLVLVAGRLGQTGTNGADVNGDSVVNIQDLVLVAGALGTSAAAPALNAQALSTLTAADVKLWLSQAQQLTLTDAASLRGIQFLEQLLTALTPKETVLLANYPNPFNPETWIPYHLAKDADVTLHIYAMNGTLVRTLTLGHQSAGMYQSRSRAAYWDGKNEFGEPVASGVYFYTLTAGNFSATRKMLIRK